jgi:hypothetical protein
LYVKHRVLLKAELMSITVAMVVANSIAELHAAAVNVAHQRSSALRMH